jgi:surface protein
MNFMFYNATLFDKNISGWNVSSVTSKPPAYFSTGSALTAENSPIWFPVVLDSNQVTYKFVGSIPSGSENPFFVTGANNVVYAVMREYQIESFNKIRAYAQGTSGASDSFTHSTAGVIPFNRIVTTLMTDMGNMFISMTTFNENISSWDTSNVINMIGMFYNAQTFNQPLNLWNTSAVTNMGYMFYNAASFNQNLSGWNVALTPTRPSLNRDDFAYGSPLALPENSHKLPPFE